MQLRQCLEHYLLSGTIKLSLQGRCSSTTAPRQPERISSSPARRFCCITVHVNTRDAPLRASLCASRQQQHNKLQRYVSRWAVLASWSVRRHHVFHGNVNCFPYLRDCLTLRRLETTTNPSSERVKYRPGSSPQTPNDSRRSHRSEKLKVDSEKRSFFRNPFHFSGWSRWTCAIKFAFISTCMQPRFPLLRYNASSSLRYCCCCCGVHPEKREMQAESSPETRKTGCTKNGWERRIGILRGFAPLTNEPGEESAGFIHLSLIFMSAPGLSIHFFPLCLWFVFLHFLVIVLVERGKHFINEKRLCGWAWKWLMTLELHQLDTSFLLSDLKMRAEKSLLLRILTPEMEWKRVFHIESIPEVKPSGISNSKIFISIYTYFTLYPLIQIPSHQQTSEQATKKEKETRKRISLQLFTLLLLAFSTLVIKALVSMTQNKHQRRHCTDTNTTMPFYWFFPPKTTTSRRNFLVLSLPSFSCTRQSSAQAPFVKLSGSERESRREFQGVQRRNWTKEESPESARSEVEQRYLLVGLIGWGKNSLHNLFDPDKFLLKP